MKLGEQQDDRGTKRRPKINKLRRRWKHKAERRAAKLDPETMPRYNKYSGYAL